MSFGVSVIIPAYNAALWLEPTVAHINDALSDANIQNGEIVIVNDGSTDNTSRVAKSLTGKYPVQVIDQTNEGRFLTRKKGVAAAKYENILFIDSRVFIHKESLTFIMGEQASSPDKRVWNGHVYIAKKGNIIARFGDAITFIGWRRYFSNPRTTSYSIKDFDHYPKGTGCFFAPKDILLKAIAEFESQAVDLRNSSDDTHLIRIIARDNKINISPRFSCTYHARTRLTQFIKHTFYRGQFFVDGFLRPGNRFFYPLLAFLILSFAVPVFLVRWPQQIPVLIIGLFCLWIIEFISALLMRVEIKDCIALLVLSPLFAVVYGLGIWAAVLKRAVKKLG